MKARSAFPSSYTGSHWLDSKLVKCILDDIWYHNQFSGVVSSWYLEQFPLSSCGGSKNGGGGGAREGSTARLRSVCISAVITADRDLFLSFTEGQIGLIGVRIERKILSGQKRFVTAPGKSLALGSTNHGQ
ncbi:hypothetical protein ASPCAL11005 [Aspergillus calidoustus]|uniref:Uncharacterized protein n=1 Tax=Aspergillus calidoustus TaxID=454130 RepID=A0A0U5G8K4_ASPCI|nr:hypothetical protein ASPCAL11005 [Aspergillus calidoustus]